MLPGFNITPSTSLVLVKKLVSPSYIVYLEALQCPDFNVSIRDVTGSTLISQYPVTLSTLAGASFSDGATTQFLNVPYGFVELGFRQSSIWQLLHTSGFEPAASAANIQSLQVSTLNVQVHSTATKVVSTLVLENLFIPNSIQIAGPITFSNLSTTGLNTFESSFRVFGDVTVQNELYVSGATRFYSTLQAEATVFESNLDIGGSLGTGGNLAIGTVLNALSSLQLTSTVQVDSLQVQRSTGMTTEIANELIINGLFSTLSTVVVGQDTFAASTFGYGSLFVENTIGATEGRLLGDVFLGGSLSSLTSLTFQSSLTLLQSLTVLGTKNITSSLTVGNDVRANLLSTNTLFGFSHISSSGANIQDSLRVQGDLSTFGLFIGSTLTVSEDLQAKGSLQVTEFRNLSSSALDVRGNTYADSVVAYAPLSELGKGPFTIGIGESLQIGQNATFQELGVKGTIQIQGDGILEGPLFVEGSLDIQQDITTATFNLGGIATFSNIEAQNFTVASLRVASTFQVSTLIATEISTQNISIEKIVPVPNSQNLFANDFPIFARGLTFVSSIEASSFTAIASTIERATTDYFLQFATAAEIDAFVASGLQVPSLFWLNTDTLFQQGISTQQVSTTSIEANIFTGTFVGDGGGLTNIALDFVAISTVAFFVSSVNTYTLNTSTSILSSLTVHHDITTTSSFTTDTFRIDPIGYPIAPFTNQILVVSPSTILINKDFYVDAATQQFGVRTSTPQYTMDVNGTLYASSIAFSSIQQVNFTSTTLYLNDVVTSTLFIRDALFVTSTSGTLRFLTNAPFLPLDITSYTSNQFVSSPSVTIQSYPSTLLLNEMVHVTTSSVGIGSARLLGVTAATWPTATLDILGSFYTSSLQVSTVLTRGPLTTGTVSFSTLDFYGGSTITASQPVHSITQFSTSLIVDNLLFVDRYHQTMGIKCSTSDFTLDIAGSVFFSTLVVTSGLNVSSVTYEIGGV